MHWKWNDPQEKLIPKTWRSINIDRVLRHQRIDVLYERKFAVTIKVTGQTRFQAELV